MNQTVNFSVFFLFVTLVQFARGQSDNDENNPYRHVVNLDGKTGRYVLEWTVDWSTRRVSFEVTVQTTGFISLGLSKRGRIPGADVVIGGVDSKTGAGYLLDMHGGLEGYPAIQRDRSQNYELHFSAENRTHTRLRFSREFDTCDTEDYKINDDTVALLWGYGETDYFTGRGSSYIANGTYSTYLLDPDWTPRVIQEARRTGKELTSSELGDLEVWTVTRRHQLTERDTAYWCSMLKGPVLERRHQLIGFEFRWEDEETVEYKHTHHLLIFRCTPPTGVDPNEFFEPFVRNDTGEMCFLQTRDPTQNGGGLPTAYCTDLVYEYAIGGRLFFLPEDTGISFGYSPDEYYLLQVHYDNPERLANIEYEIDIDLYYTPNLRSHEVGITTWGHQVPGSPSILVPPNSSAHNIYGHCGGDCTKDMLPEDGITIVAIQQHTHNSGVRHRFQHFRGDVELPWIFNDDNYDNSFQTPRMTRREIKVLPGDHLVSRCVYDNVWANGSVVGGLSTREEMCLVYMWYHNKVDYLLCRSEIVDPRYSQRHLGVSNWTWSEPDLEFVVAEDGPLEGLTVSEVADRRRWPRWRREELQRDHLWMPQQNSCFSSSSLRAEGGGVGEGHLVRFPTGAQEYVPVEEGSRCR